jgi:hypothetical protein
MELPEITAVQRWTMQPGDRLVVRVKGTLEPGHAEALRDYVRKQLQVPDDFPLIITDDSAEISIINDGGDPYRWLQGQLRRNGHSLCVR